MAKTKQTTRMIAMALAAAVTMSSVPVVAFAEEIGSDSGSAASESGSDSDTGSDPHITVTVTTKTDTAEDGSTTTTVENVTKEEGTREDGTVVDREVTTTTTTTTDADGNVVSEDVVEDGEETTVTTGDATAEDLANADLPEVKVELEQGKVTTGSATGTFETTTEIEGGTTVSVTEIERVVNAALSEIATVDKSTTTIVPVIEPEDYEGKVFDDSAEVHADKFATKVDCGINHNHNFVDYDNLREMALDNKYEEMGVWGEQPEGYDFINCGKGEVTDAAAAAVKVYYYKQDENGNYVIDEDRPAHYINIDNHACIQSGMSEQISMIAMKQLKEDGTAEYFYAYCADRETPTLTTTTGYYQMVNIEDSDFYGEEAAEKMRAIAENGYWGTEEGVGSLASIKDQLKEKYSEQYNDETATLTVADKDGVEHTFTYKELIDGLKEHEALACTQGAIWNYSNGEIDPETGAKQVVEGVYSAWKFINSRGGELADYYREYDMESDARMQVLYEYLIGLEGEKAEDVIVSAENSFDSTTLVVGEKVGSYIVFDEASGKDVDVNNDDNPDNDAYNTSIEFTLAFIPDDDKDTITVAVWDPVNGKVMTDANGDPIVRTLLKDGSTKEVENGITPDANGAYRLDGLVFQENTGVQFDLKLEGMQNLEQGVYLYQAYGGKEASQTMIGLGAGVQDVDVTKSMTLTFDVDENKTVTAKSKWHKEKHNSFDTPEEPGEGGENGDDPTDPRKPSNDPEDPTTDIPEDDVPLTDVPDEDVPTTDGEDVVEVIVDEDVPLADLVLGEDEVIAETGDSNHMTAGFGGMLAALAGMFMLRRKKEQ